MSLTESKKPGQHIPIQTSIAPWLSVRDGKKALAFYQSAFDAKVVYRLEDPDGGLVLRLSVEGAEFWISGGASSPETSPEMLGGDTVRMILTVADPHDFFNRAIKAGAREVFPVGEEYGWKLGRVVDPFGLHWEIGHQTDH